jgi:phage shock protein PspC (stress-responsive transcriptional regulator)
MKMNVSVPTKVNINYMKKQLVKSQNKLIAGVCGGIAEYFDFDYTVVRLVYALLTIFTLFSGVIVYLILWAVMPKQ